VPVIDRGPFRRGVAWDLTAAAAKRLGMGSTTRLRSTR
jgi:rare lipoprotein A (peptidoglycan hydrolase)